MCASNDGRPISHRHLRAYSDDTISLGDKHIPYYSDRYILQTGDRPVHLNGKILRADKRGMITCRHLAAQFVLSGRQNSGKILPHELFGSPQAIKDHVDPDIEALYYAELAHACGKYIFPNDRLGHYLSCWAASLEQDQQKHFLLQSKRHAFAIRLHRKTNIEESSDSYVVHFYDPNITNIKVRCAVKSPQAFDSPEYALSQFMSADAYHHYFKEFEQECLVYDCSQPSHPQPRFLTVDYTPEDGPSGTALFYLLGDGKDPAAIRAIAEFFRSLPTVERGERLAAMLDETCSGKISGLALALQWNHADAIEAYGELLSQLPDQLRRIRLPTLLAAWREEGTFGLFVALQRNHVDAIQAYGRLLTLLPEDMRGTELPVLLAAIEKNGNPGLFIALQMNNADAIRAYGELLNLLPEDDREAQLFQLLAARREDGAPGLAIAMQKNSADAIRAFGELLNLLPARTRSTLLPAILAARRPDGIAGLLVALQKNSSDAITAYGELLNLLPERARNTDLPSILAARTPDGTPGLFEALRMDSADAIVAYGDLLNLLPERYRSTLYMPLLLAAKDTEGTPGFKMAEQQRNDRALDAYFTVVTKHLVTPDQRSHYLTLTHEETQLTVSPTELNPHSMGRAF